MRSLLMTVAVLTVMGTTAHADQTSATLDVLQGRALIQSGGETSPAAVGQRVFSGDRITLLADSAAVIANPGTGCVLALRDPGAYVVPELETCNSVHVEAAPEQFVIEPANGVYQPVVFVPPPPPLPVVAGLSPVLVGGTFVAGVAGIVAVQKVVENRQKPISGY